MTDSFCASCGNRLPAGGRFCPACGTRRAPVLFLTGAAGASGGPREIAMPGGPDAQVTPAVATAQAPSTWVLAAITLGTAALVVLACVLNGWL
jgi:hypothetical protein